MRGASLGTRRPPTSAVSPKSPVRVYTRVIRIAMASSLLSTLRLTQVPRCYTADMADWHTNIVTDDEDIARIVKATRRIAVLGIKTEAQRDAAAFYVPEYMQRVGYDIVPVPVYYPDVTEILGHEVYRTVSEFPGRVDMVNVFRRGRDIPPPLPDT